jgi:hypothetical protein
VFEAHVESIVERRQAALNNAYDRTPQRFVAGPPVAARPPQRVMCGRSLQPLAAGARMFSPGVQPATPRALHAQLRTLVLPHHDVDATRLGVYVSTTPERPDIAS